MKIDKKGRDFIFKEEGCILHPYKDAVGVPTIGVGSTFYEDGTKVQMTDKPITLDRATQLFSNVVKQFETAVNKAIKVPLTQNQFNALTSLCFNIGTSAFAKSTLVKKINGKAPKSDLEKWLLVWCNAGGKPILLSRRKREFTLYNA